MGILSTNSTLDIKDTASGGVVNLAPLATDTSTATINRTNAGNSVIMANHNCGYVRLNNANQLKLGNADLTIGSNAFFAALVRLPNIESSTTGNVRILETNGTTGGGFKHLSFNVRGATHATTGDRKCLAFDVANQSDTAVLSNVINSDNLTVNTFREMLPFGANGYIAPTAKDWHWVWFARNTDYTLAQIAGQPFFNAGFLTILPINNMVSGFTPYEGGVLYKELFYAQSFNSTSITPATPASGLNTISNVDFTLGGVTAGADCDLDIAQIIFMSNNLLRQDQITRLMSGAMLEDFGITTDANNFILNLSSLATAGAKISEVSGFSSGQWKTTATDGARITKKVGDITTTLAATITAGKVNS